MENLILKTDSYKLTHWGQYPYGTTKISSYLESRGGEFDSTLFFGLQYIIKKHLLSFNLDVEEGAKFCEMHFGSADLFNAKGWALLKERHGSKLPIIIKAVKEGVLVSTNNVLMTIENTDPDFPWLPNFLETLLMHVWYSTTIATNSFYAKRMIKESLDITADTLDSLPFKLHDFGYRGVTCDEQAGIGGAAHLVSFSGTDNISSILNANQYYTRGLFQMYGYSVPASEHSTMTSWGIENEDNAILNMLRLYTKGIVSVVGDSYNIYDFCRRIAKDPIRSQILSRDGVFVVRPDSGDPLEVISKILDILWEGFGGTYNSKHFKVLDSHIRILQGDGIDLDMIDALLTMIRCKGFSTENITFGSGGGLLQKFDRDTCKFAIKASYGECNSTPFDIQKDPITSSGKKSKKGKLKLHNAGTEFMTISSSNTPKAMFEGYVDSLETVFENGKLVREQEFTDIRKIAERYL